MDSKTRAIAFCLLVFAGLPTGAVMPNAEILDHRTVTLPAPPPDRAMTMSLDVFDRELILHLEDNDAPFARLGAGKRTRIFADGNRFLRGTVAALEGTWVRLSWVGGRWSGGIFDGRELYLLDAAEAVADMAVRGLPDGADLVLFRLADLRLPGLVHSRPVYPGDRPDYRDFAGHLGSMVQGATEALPVTIVSDTQFSATHNPNTDAVTAGRINFVDGIYTSEVGVGIALHHHEILDSDGPLTSDDPETLLIQQFQPFMTNGAGSGIPFAGVAHLFTGRNLDGAAGIAFLGVLCDPNSGFGVDQNLSSETVSGLLFAHELGHNFGAPHDNEAGSACEQEAGGRIMAPVVGPGTAHEFSDCSLQEMQNHIPNATCLVETVLFRDRFEQ